MDSVKLSDLKDGDIVIWTVDIGFRIEAILSMGVSLFTMSKYTHVGIVRVINDEMFILEAQYPKVRYIRVEDMMPTHVIQMDVVLDDYIHGLLNTKIGRDYSIKQAICSTVGYYIDDTEWYCTEIAYFYLKAINIDIPKKLKPGTFVKNLSKKLNKPILRIEKELNHD